MKRMTNCCTLASVSALVMLTVFPVISWSKLEPYDTQTQSDRHCCVMQDVSLKRFEDIDQDSFVSLFGRRSVPKANRVVDRILAGLLRRASGHVPKDVIISKEHPRAR